MLIEAILRSKGSEVETVRPDAAVTMAAQRMAALRIGCLVVADSSAPVLGLLTERDLVRAFAHHGTHAASLSSRQERRACLQAIRARVADWPRAHSRIAACK